MTNNIININNKKIEDKKDKMNDEEDDVIFGEYIKINGIDNENKTNEQQNINNNKIKSYQRPNDKKRKICKDNDINIKNNQSNKKTQKETNIIKNIKKNNIFSSFNEVISQKDFNNNIKNSNSNRKNKNKDINYDKDIVIPIDKKSETISFNIKQLVNESFSAKNIKNDNKLLNNFINHSGIFPSNEINNFTLNRNKDRTTNKSVDLFYGILNMEQNNNNRNYKDIGNGYSYNNFIDKNNYKFNNNIHKK